MRVYDKDVSSMSYPFVRPRPSIRPDPARAPSRRAQRRSRLAALAATAGLALTDARTTACSGVQRDEEYARRAFRFLLGSRRRRRLPSQRSPAMASELW